MEVFQDFKSVIVPIQYLLDLIPFMAPRYFSISSSPDVHTGQIHLTIAIVEYKTKLTEPRVGVCTNWMKQWKQGGNGV
jgi:sulfite reductase alpha subunit-like flavoprotein